MSAIKDMYGKAKLSDEKKAELKNELGQRFPRYADSMEDKTEVIGMNDNKVHESNGHIKVHSKLRTGAVIAAAAVVAVIGGMKLARDQYTEKALIQPAGQGEDNYTTDREDSVKEDYSPQEGYIEIADKTILRNIKIIHNSACEAYADLIESTGDELVLGEEKMITPEMVRKSRETKIVHENGKCSALEFAAAMDKYIYGSLDEDLTQYDFAVDFMFNESGTKTVSVNYVYIFLDDEHKYFNTYPSYGLNGGVTENGITKRFSYDSSCAKKVYEELETAIIKYNESGKPLNIDSFQADTTNEYLYLIYDYECEDLEENDKMKFARELLKDGSITKQLSKDGNNFEADFKRDDNGNIIGVERVYVEIFDDESAEYDENGNRKCERFVYPDENKTDKMTVTIPDVAGKNKTEAISELESLGFKIDVHPIEYEDVPEDTVLITKPEAGNEIEFGSQVKIYVSGTASKEQLVSIPDVVGKDKNDAVSEIQSQGFNTTIYWMYSDTVPEGTVIFTEPSSARSVRPNERVMLVVSKGHFDPAEKKSTKDTLEK